MDRRAAGGPTDRQLTRCGPRSTAVTSQESVYRQAQQLPRPRVQHDFRCGALGPSSIGHWQTAAATPGTCAAVNQACPPANEVPGGDSVPDRRPGSVRAVSRWPPRSTCNCLRTETSCLGSPSLLMPKSIVEQRHVHTGGSKAFGVWGERGIAGRAEASAVARGRAVAVCRKSRRMRSAMPGRCRHGSRS